MSGRKTVLIVGDDPVILGVPSDGVSSARDPFDVVTASNGLEAVRELESRSVDVLVTDLAMPEMDGFALIAYVTQQHSALPVVALSGMVESIVDQRLADVGGLRVLRKPASHQEVATCVLAEIERVDRGLIEGIPLSGVLQLIEAERRSFRVVVTSGRRRGQLDFETGRLVNAFSDDFGAEGDAAAYDILGWDDTSIELEPLPANVRRPIHTPMQLLLGELATARDRGRERDASDPPDDEVPTLADAADSDPGPLDGMAAEFADEPLGDPAAFTFADVPGAPDDAGADDAPAPSDADAPDIARAAVDAPQSGGDSILLDDPESIGAPEVENDGATAAAPLGDGDGASGDGAGGDATAATEPTPPPPEAPDVHVRDMLAAIERLAQRAKTADEALAAVSAEIDAFREAQRRFDDAKAQREQRRRDLERFRDEVAHLAREILGRVDNLFDAMASDPAPGDVVEERPAT